MAWKDPDTIFHSDNPLDFDLKMEVGNHSVGTDGKTPLTRDVLRSLAVAAYFQYRLYEATRKEGPTRNVNAGASIREVLKLMPETMFVSARDRDIIAKMTISLLGRPGQRIEH